MSGSGSTFYEDHRFYDQESTFDHDPFSMDTDYQEKNLNNNDNNEYNNNGLIEMKKNNLNQNNPSFGIYYQNIIQQQQHLQQQHQQQQQFQPNNVQLQAILMNSHNNNSNNHQTQQINNIAINQFQNNTEIDIQQHNNSNNNNNNSNNIFNHPVTVNIQPQGNFIPQDHNSQNNHSASMKRELLNSVHYQTTTTTTTTTNGFYTTPLGQTQPQPNNTNMDANNYYVPNTWIPGEISKSQGPVIPPLSLQYIQANSYSISSPQSIPNRFINGSNSTPGTPVSLLANTFVDQFSIGSPSMLPNSPNTIPTSPTASKKSLKINRRGKVTKQDSLDNLSIPKQSIKDSKKSNSSPNLKKQILSQKMSLIPQDSRSLIPGDDLNSSTESFGSDLEGIKSPRSPRTTKHGSKLSIQKINSSSNNLASSPSLNSSHSSLLTPTMSGLSLSASGSLPFSPITSQNNTPVGSVIYESPNELSGSSGYQYTGQLLQQQQSNNLQYATPFSPQILNGFFTKDQELSKKLKESLLPDQNGSFTLEQEIQNLLKVISSLDESIRIDIMNSIQELCMDSQNPYSSMDTNSSTTHLLPKKVINFYILRLMMLINPTSEIPIPSPNHHFTPLSPNLDENDEIGEEEDDDNFDNSSISNSSNSINIGNSNSNLFEDSLSSNTDEFNRTKKLKTCNIEMNDCINNNNNNNNNSNNMSNSGNNINNSHSLIGSGLNLITKTNRNKKISKVNSTNSIHSNMNSNGLFSSSNQMYNQQSPRTSSPLLSPSPSSYVYNPYGASTTTSITTSPPPPSSNIIHHPIQRHNSLPAIFNNTAQQQQQLLSTILAPSSVNNNNIDSNSTLNESMDIESNNNSNGEGSSSPTNNTKKRRSSFTDHQTKVLNDYFKDKTSSETPTSATKKFTTEEIQQIADKVGLKESQVKVYFQNRRARKNKLALTNAISSSNIPPSSTISIFNQDNDSSPSSDES